MALIGGNRVVALGMQGPEIVDEADTKNLGMGVTVVIRVTKTFDVTMQGSNVDRNDDPNDTVDRNADEDEAQTAAYGVIERLFRRLPCVQDVTIESVED